MKSLVEEASSVAKAIEKAWIRAGKPTSFSVKVYEEAQSGFLGFNSKPAKIGLFFEEHAPVKNNHNNDGRKKHHNSYNNAEEQDRSPRQPAKFEESRAEDTQEKKPYNATNRERSPEGHRPPSRRRRPNGYEKRDQDRGERPDRDNRDRSERRKPAHFEKREHSADSHAKPVNENAPKNNEPVAQTQPAQPQQQAPAQQNARRVLKVSSRRYSASKNNTPTTSQSTAVTDTPVEK